MTLLEKFDAIQLSDEDQIPAVDKEWCEKEQENFKVVLQHLDEKEQHFRDEEQIEKQIDTCHRFYEYPDSNIYGVSKSWKDKADFNRNNDDKNYYDLFRFSSGYQIEWIMKTKNKIKADFIKNITLYFVEKYNLEVPECHINKDLIDERCDFKVILKLIKEHLGGFLDFKGSAVEQAIVEIQEQFKWKSPSVMSSIISFDRFVYGRGTTEYPSINGYNSYNKEWTALDKAIAIFETEEVKDNYAIMYLAGKPSGEWDIPLNGEKLEAIKLFKNGKLQLKFKEPSFANSFITRFNLKTS